MTLTRTPVVALAATLLLALASATVAQEPIGPLELGHRAYKSKRWDDAASFFAKARNPYWFGRAQFSGKHYASARKGFRKCKPSDAMASLYLGRTCLELDDPKAAVVALVRANSKKPGDKRILYYLGTAHRRAGEPHKAIMPFTELATLSPTSAGPQAELGQVFLEARQPQAATQAFSEAIRRAPKRARNYTWLGIAHFRMRSFAGAKEALRNALRRDAKNPTSHYWLGRTLYELRDYARAARAFQEGSRLDPKSPLPRLWLARAYVGAGDRDAALSALGSVAKASRDGPLLAYYGRLLAESGRNDTAAAVLRRAAQLAPNDSSLLRDQAEAHVALGQEETAIRVLEHAVKVAKDDLAAWRRLGGLRALAGDLPAARDAYRHLVLPVVEPSHEDVALLARAELACRNPAAAVKHFKRALANRPKGSKPSPVLIGDLGVAQFGVRAYDDAAASLLLASETLNKDSRLLDYLGRSLHQLKKLAHAAGVFKRSIRAPGGNRRAQPPRYLALYALEAKRIPEARKYAEAAVKIAPKNSLCREIAGRAALAGDDPNSALTHFAIAAKADPKRLSLSLLAGKAAVMAGRSREAMPYLKRALKRDPALANLWLGRALLAQKRAREAAEHLTIAAKALPKSVSVWLSLAQAQLAAKQPKQAVQSLRSVTQLEPKRPSHREALVSALVGAKALGDADDERRAWLTLALPTLVDSTRPRADRADNARVAARDERVPKALRGEALLLRAELLDSLGDLPGAQAALVQAESETPWSYRSKLLAGGVAEQLQTWRSALEHYAEAKRRAPRRAAPAVATARAYLGEGHVRAALNELRDAVRLHPTVPAPTLELIRLLSLREERQLALSLLARAGRALDNDAKTEVRSSRDFSSLWNDPSFRNLLGDPLPGHWGRKFQGERVLSGPGNTAYLEAGELVE